MKLHATQTALLLSLLPTTSAFAAALDRSGQSISAFLQPSNYFEAGITFLSADVSGKIHLKIIQETWQIIITHQAQP